MVSNLLTHDIYDVQQMSVDGHVKSKENFTELWFENFLERKILFSDHQIY